MDFHTLNQLLSDGKVDEPGLFPRLEQLKNAPYQFEVDFGLNKLPEEGGILLVRGARQYGKSTWLEKQIKETIITYGKGTAFYLNGDYIADGNQLEHEIEALLPAYSKHAPVKRLFIDEITAIPRWEVILKRLADRGRLADVLVITTGSKATDLRRASERLPGRKGKLSRTTYLFTPISFQEFHRLCGKTLGKDTLVAYLLSGGSPIACVALAKDRMLPEYVIELTRDWIEGEVSASGRSRAALLNVLSALFRYGTTPVGQAKLAREAALANNTVASGYIELLNDLMSVVPAYPWETNKKMLILRKPCKYHFSNLLVAVAYSQERMRSIDDFLNLSSEEQGKWYEWLVAQELLRRQSIKGDVALAPLAFYQDKNHEIDFVQQQGPWIEVKRGKCSPLEFSWLSQGFPKTNLLVINSNSFTTNQIQGLSMEEFLLQGSR